MRGTRRFLAVGQAMLLVGLWLGMAVPAQAEIKQVSLRVHGMT